MLMNEPVFQFSAHVLCQLCSIESFIQKLVFVMWRGALWFGGVCSVLCYVVL